MRLPCLFLWSSSIGWFTVPLVAYGVIRNWIGAIYTSFETVQVTINEQGMTYWARSWLGYSKKESLPIQHITRLEKSHFSYFNYSMLKIWSGNRYYAIAQDRSFGGFRRLTSPEVDWLAFELSDWLDLPIQNLNGQAQSTESSRLEEPQPISLPYSLNLSKIERPDHTVCTIKKSAESIEISAPAEANVNWAWIGGCLLWLIGFPYLVMVIASLAVQPWIGLVLGALPIVVWRIRKRLNQHLEPAKISLQNRQAKILLQINQDTVSIWEKSQVTRCLNKVPREAIRSTQIAYLSNTKSSSNYHIQLKTNVDFSSIHSKDNFKVGNRTFWLSRQEAHWLAYELSSWLELPVTAVEVIDNNVVAAS